MCNDIPTPIPNSCFLSHAGAFWGAFLTPILIIMVFNVNVFICVIFVLIRHVKGTTAQMKQEIEYKKIIHLMIRIGGVMSLFGLTWLFAILTVSVPGLREVFQILFTVSNSFQGCHIFFFLCVLNKEARESWRKVCVRKRPYFQVFSFIANLSKKHESSALESTANVRMSSHHSAARDTESESLHLSNINSSEVVNADKKLPSS